METLFSTRNVHRRERFSYWHEIACDNLVHHEAWPDDRLGFEAEISAGRIAALDIVLFENSPMRVSTTRTQRGKLDDDFLFSCQQMEGQLDVEQAGREARLGKGDMVLLDPAIPYAATFRSGSKTLVLKLPRRAMRARLGDFNGSVGQLVAPTEIEDKMIAAFISALPQWAGHLSEPTDDMLQTYCTDLVASTIGRLVGQRSLISSGRASALMAVRTAIEARLHDPELSPAMIAAAAGVGVRYANALLAREGTSLSRLLLSRRLDRCRKALGNPSQAHRTISDIAYGWGFSDMTHFSRSFKREFGMLPTEYRRGAAEHSTPSL